MTDTLRFSLAESLRTREVLDSAAAMIDGKGTVAGWTSATQRLAGYATEEAVGRPVWCVLPFLQDAPHLWAASEQRRARGGRSGTVTIRHRDGHTLHVSLRVSPLQGATEQSTASSPAPISPPFARGPDRCGSRLSPAHRSASRRVTWKRAASGATTSMNFRTASLATTGHGRRQVSAGSMPSRCSYACATPPAGHWECAHRRHPAPGPDPCSESVPDPAPGHDCRQQCPRLGGIATGPVGAGKSDHGHGADRRRAGHRVIRHGAGPVALRLIKHRLSTCEVSRRQHVPHP